MTEEKPKKISIIEKLNYRFSKVPIKQKIFFVQQLGIMIKTGISLAVALKTLAEQIKHKKFKKILTAVQAEVEQGNLFSKSLEKYKKTFGELFVSMIQGGEMSGKLEDVMAELFIQMKKDHAIVSKVRGAMIYPAVILTAMVGVGIMVVIYVIPSLTSIFDEMNATLPLPTRVLIKISEIVNKYGLIIVGGVVTIIVGFIFTIKNPKGKFIFHKILLSTPIAGGIIKKINLARFSRTFSSLLKTDIAIIKTFEITSNVLGNHLYKRALIEAKEKVKKGQRIEEALRPYDKLFPPVIIQMISVGEETGSLDDILTQTAQFYEDDVDQTMTTLPSLIEPVLILVLGVGVAMMAVAIIMPMYSLSQSI